jgi:hypothetical protein
MRIIVVGAQHSCTRLFVGLLDVHPDAELVAHMSIPSDGKLHRIRDMHPADLEKYDRICVVTRDATCINLSNSVWKDGEVHVPLSENISKKAYDSLLGDLEYIEEHDDALMSKIHFVSYEALVHFGYLYMRSICREIGLNAGKYPPKNLLSAIKSYTPKVDRWFSIGLNISDSNKKYFDLEKYKRMEVERVAEENCSGDGI